MTLENNLEQAEELARIIEENKVLEEHAKKVREEYNKVGNQLAETQQCDVSTLFRTTCYADFCIFSYSSYSTGDK
jgi:hypothetical protein